jgi:predicted trehalose synthase
MYRAGVYQADLHGGNFLRAEGRLWLIDPGAVEGEPGQPLDSARVVDNLGLLVAQFRRCDQAAVLQSVLAHPVSALAGGGQALHDAAENHWQRRKRDYLAKIFRTSTAVRFERRFDRVWACRRERSDPELDAFLCDPDTAMARGELLKDGNSATVVRTVLDGRAVVIKRYNIKGFGHWLRRFWRPSRAWVSWRNAHLLALVGIDTPAPVAMLERRAGPLRGRAYYVCDSVDAEELLDVAVRRPLSDAQLNALRHLFACLRCAQLHHGDLKAKNILMSTERAWLIDLDALREVPSSGAFDRRHRKDVARFLRNWPDAPALVASMKQVVAGGGIG